MAEEHVAAMDVLKRKKSLYAQRRKEVTQISGNTTVINQHAIAECQLLLLEISYLESRVLQLSSMDLSFME